MAVQHEPQAHAVRTVITPNNLNLSGNLGTLVWQWVLSVEAKGAVSAIFPGANIRKSPSGLANRGLQMA